MTVRSNGSWPRAFNSIPKTVYTDASLYARELERIFRGSEWHAIAHESEVPAPGDFRTLTHAHTPLLIARGKDGVVRVFYNSCPHRGNQVETSKAGNRARFACPYHRWTFATDGKLIGCPSEAEYAPGFDRADYPLAMVRMEMFKGIIFVTFSDETIPLEDYLGDLKPTIARAVGGDGRLKLLGYQKVRYAANWKIYGDNDVFHGPLLHKALNLLSWQANNGFMKTCTDRGHVALETDLVLPPDSGLIKDMSIVGVETDGVPGSCAVIMYPTFVMTKHLDVINLRFATPIGPDRTEVSYAYFAHQDDSPAVERHRIRQGSNLLGPTGFISMEDAAIFHRSQIGAHTPGDVVFQKGVRDTAALQLDYKFNDESHALVHWEHYRNVMGFDREPA
ncbi:aromatic ring-hydroxylating dioxygenase subunit alpha [Sphingomonas sp. 1P06PA]|uniref:aromatic ring-hydroxylating oxygenase subunit alpha n=1 Tax=Sphingomonas sp. 1P06PA TaxID=554121 RepID=UPI0039A5BB54